jgi:hypothetical protein
MDSRLDLEAPGPVWEKPLAALGVPGGAAVVVHDGRRETAFILACPDRS